MATRARHLTLTLLAAGSVVVAVGCSDGGDSAGETLATIATPTVEPTTEPPLASTLPPSTPPATTAPPPTPEPTTTTSTTAPVTSEAPTTTTTAPATTAAPTSTPTPGPTGLGVVEFGAGADATVGALTAALGEPTADSGWVEPGRISSCGGAEARRVEWGVLSVVLGEPQVAGGDPRQFVAYAYGDVSEVGAEPKGLTTAEGIGLGSSVADLQAAYPDVEVFAGEEGLFEASFSIAEGFAGLLTSDAPDGAVTVIYGGPCE